MKRCGVRPDTPEARELYDKVIAIPFWFHSIDLGMGVVTPGIKSPEKQTQELTSLRLPDLRGKSVLDIGAWDGFYSFAAERLGAARVMALDYHVWALDREAKNEYKAACREKGILQQHPKDLPWLWRSDELPGKRGFDLAHATGIQEIVKQGQTGWFVPPGDHDELVAALGTLLSDSTLRSRLATRALEEVHQRFSADRLINQFEVLYRQTIDRHNLPAEIKLLATSRT